MSGISLEQWLTHFRFTRFPFDRPESGNEEFSRPEFLSACFVEPKIFARLIGQPDSPVTALLFAARGSGKTACLVMADYYSKTGSYPLHVPRLGTDSQRRFVLSVPHIRLREVMNIYLQQYPHGDPVKPLLEHHAEEILRRAVYTLAGLIENEFLIQQNIDTLSHVQRQELAWLNSRYGHYLEPQQAELLDRLNILFPKTSRKLPEWQRNWEKNRQKNSPIENISRWAALMPSLGIEATYILVDGLDEFAETASDPYAAYSFIRPLLTDLRLMENIPKLAFKFFLPEQLQELIYTDEAVRKDRGLIFLSLDWDENILFEMLDKRLAALNRDAIEQQTEIDVHFADLCVTEQRETIRAELIKHAGGNPRHLFVLCGIMVSAHLERTWNKQDDPSQLNTDDLQRAVDLFQTRLKPSFLASADGSLDFQALIKTGEGERIEFKSSLRFDYKGNKYNRDALEPQIARAIAGLFNRDGGIVLIGVQDDGQIVGIEKDFETFRNKNIDGFQLAVKDVVKKYLGLECMPYIRLHFESLQSQTVCAIAVKKSPSPVFMHTGKGDEFYVRLSTATQKMDLPEAVKYIRSRWP